MIQKNKTALQRAADLLARQEQSEKVLRQKLLLRKYETEEIGLAFGISGGRVHLFWEEKN
ncbi:MAG: hypothetical protein IJT73_07825 [Selenomonadaceae bacterium]|nr:hypothetical protein [Selenomonadaceae bacterium]